MELRDLVRIYDGSDGEATKKLYSQLECLGPIGLVALNLFRAQKCSARAKVYRGGIRGKGSYRSMAYERKQWSMDNLCKILIEHAAVLNIPWGWKEDPDQSFHAWVLYIDLPSGQVSFHTAGRGAGPDYPGNFDGIRGLSTERILFWIGKVFGNGELNHESRRRA